MNSDADIITPENEAIVRHVVRSFSKNMVGKFPMLDDEDLSQECWLKILKNRAKILDHPNIQKLIYFYSRYAIIDVIRKQNRRISSNYIQIDDLEIEGD